MAPMSALIRVRRIALALPGVNERMSHGEPCFFVVQNRPLCSFRNDHSGTRWISLWCPVPPGTQKEMVSAEPVRFFAPPISSSGVFRDWLGVYLDTTGPHRVDWHEIAAMVEDAFRHAAPASLIEELDHQPRARGTRS